MSVKSDRLTWNSILLIISFLYSMQSSKDQVRLTTSLLKLYSFCSNCMYQWTLVFHFLHCLCIYVYKNMLMYNILLKTNIDKKHNIDINFELVREIRNTRPHYVEWFITVMTQSMEIFLIDVLIDWKFECTLLFLLLFLFIFLNFICHKKIKDFIQWQWVALNY